MLVNVGAWPPWTPLFLLTCSRNPQIHWHIFSDAELPGPVPANVQRTRIDLPELVDTINRRLGLKVTVAGLAGNLYKLHDFKPSLAVLFPEATLGYDFFGWTDFDLLYGDLESFVASAAVDHDVISTRAWCISGHMALLRNEPRLREACLSYPNFEWLMNTPNYMSFDEWFFMLLFRNPCSPPDGSHGTPPRLSTYDRRLPDNTPTLPARVLAVEQFTTPFSPGPWIDGEDLHPTTWYWYQGLVLNARNGGRTFPYVHFMNFKGARWLPEQYGPKAPWESLTTPLVRGELAAMTDGIRLDLAGFHPLTETDREYLQRVAPIHRSA